MRSKGFEEWFANRLGQPGLRGARLGALRITTVTKESRMRVLRFNQVLSEVRRQFPRLHENSPILRFWAGCAWDALTQEGIPVDTFLADLKSRRADSAKRDKELRQALRQRFGSGRYRITATDQVEVYDVLPGTTRVRWQSYGDRKQAAERLEMGR